MRRWPTDIRFLKALSALLMLLLPGALPAAEEAADPIQFDHAIFRGDRLEFYRLDDFGPPGSPCHECRTAQHVNCNPSCYAEIPSLSLVCTQKIHALSVGPFTHEQRGRIIGELFKTDSVFINTELGEETLASTSISSESSQREDDYAIDIKGLEGFKNSLIRASSSERDHFGIQVGSAEFAIPLNPRIRDDLNQFIRQCPD